MTTLLTHGEFPVWLKLSYTLFVLVLIPVYSSHYGPGNFLWFSDLALILLVPALWLENRLLTSMIAVGVLLPEMLWTLDFFGRVFTGHHPFGLTRYMFDANELWYLRLLSLFHLMLPPLLLWMLYKLGYDQRSFYLQIVSGWFILIASYLLTEPSENINWVFGPGRQQSAIPSFLYFLIAMSLLPILVHLPTHLILKKFF